ncbi:MAG: hypothetical protein ACM3VW_08310 [Bacteroidota bacterium]
MSKLLPLDNFCRTLICSCAAIAAIPCLAQTAESAGAASPEDAASGALGQTNVWVLVTLFLAIAAIVVALVFRKRPAALTN